MDKGFGGVIWTNHALERLRQRGVSQGDAWTTWRRPQQSRYAKEKGAWIFYRTYKDQRIEVVAKQNPSANSGQAGQWVILSVWTRHVFEKKKPKSPLKFLLDKVFRV